MNQDQAQVPAQIPVQLNPYQHPVSQTTQTPTRKQASTLPVIAKKVIGESVYQSGFVPAHPKTTYTPPDPFEKYHSVQHLQEAEKETFLKDTKLNPNLIEDGFDQVAHGLHLWTVVGAKAQADKTLSPERRAEIAGNFYDRVIGPAYAHLYQDRDGEQYITKEQWKKNAYTEALQYNIHEAYSNSMTHGSQGWDTGVGAEARAFGKLASMVHGAMDDAVAWWRQTRIDPFTPGKDGKYQHTPAEHQAAIKKAQEEAQDYWSNWANVFHLPSAAVKSTGGVLSIPQNVAHHDDVVQKTFRQEDENDQFWAAALPTRGGFTHKASSMVAEQVAQTPLYIALAYAGPARLAEGFNLTASLATSTAGKWALRSLLAGSEGLAYGTAVRKQDDPNEGIRDAIGFAVFHQLFEVGGWGTKKLLDVAPDSWKPSLLKRSNKLDLAQQGQRLAKATEIYDDHVTEVAGNLEAGGPMAQRAINTAALHHIERMESVGFGPAEIEKYQAKKLDPEQGGDPAAWAPVFSAAKYIRSVLGKRQLSSMKAGSATEQELSVKLEQLLKDAGTRLNTHGIGTKEAGDIEAEQTIKKPSAQPTLQYYEEQIKAELATKPGALQMASPQDITAQAQKRFIRDAQAAAEEAEKHLTESKVGSAQKAANRRRVPAQAAIELKTRRSQVKGGESVSVKAVPFDVRLAAHRKAAAALGKNFIEFLKDPSFDEEFTKDMTDYFYPKALRDAKVFFENQHTREGIQNPNLLVFMRNYSSQMPKEYAQALEERTLESVKGQKYFNMRNQLAPQLDYYAKAMYNHVDNFLASGHWPAESNLFRSSNETIFKTTEWQRQLLVERGLQEQNMLKDMYATEPKALKTALTLHQKLNSLRMSEFRQASIKRGSQDYIRAYSDEIANELTKTGYHERWDF